MADPFDLLGNGAAPPPSQQDTFFFGLNKLGTMLESLTELMHRDYQTRHTPRDERVPNTKVPEPQAFTGRTSDVDKFLGDVVINFRAQR
jgi:hypothetical protein